MVFFTAIRRADLYFSDNDKTNFGRLNGTKFKKIKRFFDKFGNVAGYAKRTICRFAVQSDALKPKQILSAIAAILPPLPLVVPVLGSILRA